MNQEQNTTLFEDQAPLEMEAQPLIQRKNPYLPMWDSIDDILNCKNRKTNANCCDVVDAVPIKQGAFDQWIDGNDSPKCAQSSDASHDVWEPVTFNEQVSDASSDESGDTFEVRTPVQRVSGLSGLMKLDYYRANGPQEVLSRYSSKNLDALFVEASNFSHDFSIQAFEPPRCRHSLTEFVEAATYGKVAEQQLEIEEQRVDLQPLEEQVDCVLTNSNSFPRDSSTSLPTAQPSLSTDLPDVLMVETESPQSGSNALVRYKSTKVPEISNSRSEDDLSDQSLTTECSDGPGCRVPWLKRARKCKVVPTKTEKLQKLRNSRTKRIRKLSKSAMKKRAKGPKRVYRKKAIRFFKSSAQVSSDVSKSDIQVEPKELEAAVLDKACTSSPRNDGDLILAPPFTASFQTASEAPVCHSFSVAQQNYRHKLLRYWKKKYTARTERHVYEARQRVAGRRLRIEGRFITTQQAYEILAMDESNAHSADALQEMLTSYANEKKKISSTILARQNSGDLFMVEKIIRRA